MEVKPRIRLPEGYNIGFIGEFRSGSFESLLREKQRLLNGSDIIEKGFFRIGLPQKYFYKNNRIKEGDFEGISEDQWGFANVSGRVTRTGLTFIKRYDSPSVQERGASNRTLVYHAIRVPIEQSVLDAQDYRKLDFYVGLVDLGPTRFPWGFSMLSAKDTEEDRVKLFAQSLPSDTPTSDLVVKLKITTGAEQPPKELTLADMGRRCRAMLEQEAGGIA